MGIYIFGGQKANKIVTNELFIIRAYPKKPENNCYFCEDYLECVKPNISGKPPIARSNHNATLVESRYLVIYGGINPELQHSAGTTCVNDIVLLNLNHFQWETVAVSGPEPEGRWDFTISAINNRVIIFGGNLEEGEYDTHLYTIDLADSRTTSIPT